jgi:hypoxanthine phosphoribosyltransferase
MSILNHLTWKDIETLVENLAKKIQQSGVKYDYIVGLPRGGMIPAVMLSHILSIKVAETQIFKLTDIPYYTVANRVLLVDDIADSGKTLKNYSNTIDKATLCCKMKLESTDRPLYYSMMVAEEEWIVFPWEKLINDLVSKVNYKDYHTGE